MNSESTDFDQTDSKFFPPSAWNEAVEELEKRSMIFKETIISGVLLGVLLNVVASALWTLFTLSGDPTLSAQIILVVAVLFVLAFTGILGYYQYDDMKEISLRFKIVLIWDGERGEVVNLPYLNSYPPQTRLLSVLSGSAMTIQKDSKQIALKTTLEDLRRGDSLIGKYLFEIAFFQNLGSWHTLLGLPITQKKLIEVIGDNNPLVPTDHLADIAFHLPGELYFEYSRKEGRLHMKWKKGLHGVIEVRFQTFFSKAIIHMIDIHGQKFPMIDGMICSSFPTGLSLKNLIQANYIVHFSAKFHPLMLLLNHAQSRAMLSWSGSLMKRIQDRFDWELRSERAYRLALSK